MDKLNKRPRDLWLAMIDAGLCNANNPRYARFMVNRWVEQGKFIYPKRDYQHYKFSEQMIKDIVEAFKPDGIGHWDINDYKAVR